MITWNGNDTDIDQTTVTGSGVQWQWHWHWQWPSDQLRNPMVHLLTTSRLKTQEEGFKVAGFIHCKQFVPSLYGFKKIYVYGISRWSIIRSSFIKRPVFVLVILQTTFLELLPISYPTIENKLILLSVAGGGWVVIVIVRLVLSSWSQGQLSSAVGSQVVKGSWSLQLTD